MDKTIVDYLAEQRAPFADVPLSEVDSLILSTIAYFNFEKGALGNAVPSERMPLPVAVCGISHHDLFGGIWLERMGGDEFLSALLASPRFMAIEVGYYVNEVSSHFEKQFSAVTFFLPGGKAYIAYRGTDNSLAGWKEDFNLTYMEQLPSQQSARSYLEDIAGIGVEGLYVGGHSKGGNLAKYAALTCREQTFDKIARVFNHDGPGFAFTPSERIDSPGYIAKLSKTVPGASVFGMLMETRECFRVVRSTGLLFMQHATTHWAIEDGEFARLDAISPEAAVIFGTLNSWADLYDTAKREAFIDAIYGVLCAADANTWSELAHERTTSAFAIIEATAKLSPSVRNMVLSMVVEIAPIMSAKVAERARASLPTRTT